MYKTKRIRDILNLLNLLEFKMFYFNGKIECLIHLIYGRLKIHMTHIKT